MRTHSYTTCILDYEINGWNDRFLFVVGKYLNVQTKIIRVQTSIEIFISKKKEKNKSTSADKKQKLKKHLNKID